MLPEVFKLNHMQRNLLILLLLTFFHSSIFGQAANPQKIKLNCIAFLKKQLDDPGSYQGVSWSKLEKVYEESVPTGKIAALDQKIKTLKADKEKLADYTRRREVFYVHHEDLVADTNYQRALIDTKQNDSLLNVFSKERAKIGFKPVQIFDHYYIEHTFRAKNGYNALRLATYTFLIDANAKVYDYGTESGEIRRQKLLDEIQKLKETP